MRYGSVCSGVEAASLAWGKLGWTPVFFAEVEPFPCAVLQQRFNATKPLHPLDPAEAVDEKDRKMRESWLKQINKLPNTGTIPNLGDFTKIRKEDYEGNIDLLVGGTPCQDMSHSGTRKGLKGTRSSLVLDFIRLAYTLQARWFVWENVPGTFSANGGGDFARILSVFTGREIRKSEHGYLSAGFVCPDRRDRFGVAWRVLDAEFTRTPAFPRAVPQRRRRLFIVGYFGDWTRAAKVLLDPDDGFYMGQKMETPKRTVAGTHTCSVAALQSNAETGVDVATCIPARAFSQYPMVTDGITMRRYTLVETERLFGFPDNHTRIKWNGKPEEECPDTPRYKACGNSMCVNCMEWIGRRIEEFDK